MRKSGNTVGLVLLFLSSFSVLPWSGTSAQMIVDITETIETEFGVYHPYLVEINPQASAYTIEPGFSNVENYEDFNFAAEEESLLFRNAFVATPSAYKEIYDIYNECAEWEIPIFVTTDALLHTYHALYDHILRTAEEERFFIDLGELSQALSLMSESLYAVAEDPWVREALRRNVAYLGVALELLNSSYSPPGYSRDLIAAECSLIEAHQGFSLSPVFGYREDYSQFVPRGHYTRTNVLKSYFKAMMWFGRMSFIVEPPPPTFFIPCDVDSLIHESTRRALLFVYGMESTSVDGEPADRIWDLIYRPTVFFVGKADDLTFEQYRQLMGQIYGDNFATLPVDTFANDQLIEQFILAVRELPDPAVSTPTPKGLRFMGQRFIPDSYILSELTEMIWRPMPKGLDVMSVLGSERAYQIMDQVYHHPDMYPLYEAQMESLKAEFAALPDATWAQNLYYNWLYCLMPLLFPKGEGYPLFMSNMAWMDKELYTALGSWTELRHDTILYGKQGCISFDAPHEYVFNCYVEPNPYLFARLASLANLMNQGLEELGLLFEDFGERLSDLEHLLISLKVMAEKELLNESLTEDEYQLLANIGVILECLVYFDALYPLDSTHGPNYNSDDQMPLVADVHTDPVFSQTCLEEGVGYPFNLYVIVEIDGELIVTRGAGFSYFEFQQPMADRLTDEEWWVMLCIGPPDPPVWIESFIDRDQSFAVFYTTHFEFEWRHAVPEIDTLAGVRDNSAVDIPHDHQLLQNYPNPFNPTTIISYRLPSQEAGHSGQRAVSVSLEVYNVSGQVVRTLVSEAQSPGYHVVEWDGKNDSGDPVASGVYVCRLMALGIVEARSMILIR